MKRIVNQDISDLEYHNAVTLAFGLIDNGYAVTMEVERLSYSGKRNYRVKAQNILELDDDEMGGECEPTPSGAE